MPRASWGGSSCAFDCPELSLRPIGLRNAAQGNSVPHGTEIGAPTAALERLSSTSPTQLARLDLIPFHVEQKNPVFGD